jgi:hypothetical protein
LEVPPTPGQAVAILLIVGVSVRVVEYSGQLVSELAGECDVKAVCRAASSDPAGYPLLAGVDEYDDTTFNPRQAVMLPAELATDDEAVIAAAPSAVVRGQRARRTRVQSGSESARPYLCRLII